MTTENLNEKNLTNNEREEEQDTDSNERINPLFDLDGDGDVDEDDIKEMKKRAKIKVYQSLHANYQDLYNGAINEDKTDQLKTSFILELLFFITIVPMLFIAASISSCYEPSTALKHNIINNPFPQSVDNPTSITFSEITSETGYWQFVNHILYHQIYVQNNKFSIGGENFLLYGIRFRQLRVNVKSDCVVLSPEITLACYPNYSEFDESKASGFYGPILNDQGETVDYLYTWEQESVLKEVTYDGEVIRYPGNGFQVILPLDKEGAKNRLIQMQNNLHPYFDQQTRAIIMTMYVYNVNINSLTSLRLCIELTSAGVIIPSYEIISAKFWRQENEIIASTIFLVLSLIYVLIFVVRLIFQIGSCRRDVGFTLILDLLSAIFYIYVVYEFYEFSLDNAFYESFDESMVEFSNQNSSNFLNILDGNPVFNPEIGLYLHEYAFSQVLAGFIIIFRTIGIVRYLTSFDSCLIIKNVFTNSLYDFSLLFLVILILLIGFTICGNLLFTDVEAFRSISSTLEELVKYFNYDTNFYEIRNSKPFGNLLAIAYYFTFVVVFNFIASAFFIGILYTAWIIELDKKKRLEFEKQQLLSTEDMKRIEINKKKERRNRFSYNLTHPIEYLKNIEVLASLGCKKQGYVSSGKVPKRLKQWYISNEATRLHNYLSFEDIKIALKGAKEDSFKGTVLDEQVIQLMTSCGIGKLVTDDKIKNLNERLSKENKSASLLKTDLTEKKKGYSTATQILLLKRLNELLDRLDIEDRLRTIDFEERIKDFTIHQIQAVKEIIKIQKKLNIKDRLVID